MRAKGAARRKNHRWGEKVEFPLAHKSERECQNGCGIVMRRVHEAEGAHEVHWTEFWRDSERLSIGKTPACEPAGAGG